MNLKNSMFSRFLLRFYESNNNLGRKQPGSGTAINNYRGCKQPLKIRVCINPVFVCALDFRR